MTDNEPPDTDTECFPDCLRDFHFQRRKRKAYNEITRKPVNEARWEDVHIYTVDKFLSFLAEHGYHLVRTRKVPPEVESDLEETPPMTEHEADCMLEPLLADAIAVIESCAGFTDETTPVGEAWAVVRRHLQTDNMVRHEQTKLSEACEAIGRLADMIPSGHLLAVTDPVGFLDAVTAELKDLRAEVARIANEKVTQDTPND